MTDEPLRRLGDEVRHLRETRGWTRQDLAGRAGLHRNYISSLERGERNVSLLSLFKVADAFGLTIIELLEPVVTNSPTGGQHVQGDHQPTT